MSQAQAISDIITRMGILENDYADAVTNRTEAETAYKVAFATAYLKTEGSVGERKEQSFLNTQTEYVAMVGAKATERVMKEKIEDCRVSLWARREILKSESGTFDSTKSLTI